MGKYLIAALLTLTTLSAFAVCPNKINPAKVMLFVDANFGDLEIAAAQKAACKRGERLEVVPKNWKQYTVFQKAAESTLAAIDACRKKYPEARISYWGGSSGPECLTQVNAYQEASKKMRDFTSKQKQIPDQLKDRMEELSKEKIKVKITNVSLSGHDGGGHFGGHKGGISRQEVASIMGNYPVMNDVQSLLLLGCYTGVQNEVAAWKAIFPKVKIIGGYDGSAPASSRVQGHNYITNILNKEKNLLSLKNKSNVDQDVKRLIGNLGELNSAVYIDLACKEEDDEYYYASKLDRKFNKLNLNDCQKALIEMEKLKPYYSKLYSGEIEPPTETGSGESRKLYDKLRTNEHCMQNQNEIFGSNPMNSNGAFNLLFWHGVKKNFGNFYDKDMKEVEAMLKDPNADEMMKELSDQVAILELRWKDIQDQLNEYEKDPDAYKAKILAESKAAKDLSDQASKDPAFQAIMQRMYDPNFKMTPEQKVLFDKVSKLSNEAYTKAYALNELQLPPAQYVSMKRNVLAGMDGNISNQKLQMSQIPANIEKLKKIWIPTKEQMEKRTRKEVMDNLHAINGLMSSGSLPKKKYMALSFVNSVSSSHLQYLQNPFSWHEYTGETEKPPYVQTLANFMDQGNYSGYGMGGMNANPYNGQGGMMGGGGYLGGTGGGYNGGYNEGFNEGGTLEGRPDH